MKQGIPHWHLTDTLSVFPGLEIHKEKIKWLKIRSTKLDREKRFHLYIIYDDEKIREVSIAKEKISEADLKNVQLSTFYPNKKKKQQISVISRTIKINIISP